MAKLRVFRLVITHEPWPLTLYTDGWTNLDRSKEINPLNGAMGN